MRGQAVQQRGSSMPKRDHGASSSFWLWDGDAEYEGILLSVDEPRLTARMRQSHRWGLAGGPPGRPVPRDLLERQRRLMRGVCFAQSPAILLAALLEFRIETLQATKDGQFDYVLQGTFSAVPDERLEMLSQLRSDEAVRYLQSRREGNTTRFNRKPGENAISGL